MNNEENKNPEQTPKKRSVKLWIYRILMLACVIVFAISAWNLYSIWNGNQQIEKETDELRTYLDVKPAVPETEQPETEPQDETFTVDWAGLKAANPNVVAWLIVPGTGISYPVVQGSDNSYYLNHTFNGADNYIGAVFLDAAAIPDFMDDNSIIYGHSVDIGGMFTALKDFSDQAFFDSHPYFWLLTPEQNYRADVTAFYQGSDDSDIYTTDFGDYRTEVLESIGEQALYTRDIDTGNRPFVTLSTCNLAYGFHSDQRYVLMGVLQAWDEPILRSEES